MSQAARSRPRDSPPWNLSAFPVVLAAQSCFYTLGTVHFNVLLGGKAIWRCIKHTTLRKVHSLCLYCSAIHLTVLGKWCCLVCNTPLWSLSRINTKIIQLTTNSYGMPFEKTLSHLLAVQTQHSLHNWEIMPEIIYISQTSDSMISWYRE